MGIAAANAGVAPAPENLFAQEVRFGVVMYGGVSLAIYINGVTNELYEMALATPKAGDQRDSGKTRDVYRKASFLLRDTGLRNRYLAYLENPNTEDPFGEAAPPNADQRTRFVVDTIAGTSAGGINGLFLAKALVNGQEFAPLKQLWITEGDIDTLLNDQTSYDGLTFAETGSPPQSLLNSDRMYVKLLGALRNMKPVQPELISPAGNGASPLVDEIDLYVTTTDIRGTVVPLRLFDKVVYEKRYKQVYHFQYAPAGHTPHNDLSDDKSPFLAFAARCTSSFPFAFEPMSVADAERLCNARPTETAVNVDDWKPFFTGLSAADMTTGNWRKRAFGDGGYLDNKPFSYVVEALSWRLGGLPMARKLIYVEPAPSHPETERQVFDSKPDAIQNAVAAIFSIPQDETIREDLEAVLVRNRRIERVEQIVRQVEADVEADIEARDADPFARIILHEGKVPDWRSRGMRDMIAYYGAASLPYRRLRMMTVTDDIADRLAVWWGVDRGSDRLYALRAMVRVWREAKYCENRDPNAAVQKETINAFLDDYDVKYRLRRAGFILRKVHQLLDLATNLKLPQDKQQLSDLERRLLERCSGRNLPPEKLASDPVADALRCLAGGFGEAMGDLRDITWLPAPTQNEGQRKAAAGTLDQVLRLLLGEKSGATLSELVTPTGDPVQLPILPPPSPLRTLQENVFARAKFLFESAATAPKTQIQGLLETDVDLLRAAYKKIIRPDEHEGLALGRALLGNPRLEVKPGVDGAKSKVGIHVDDVNGYNALNTPDGKTVRELIAEYYVRFDEYDQMSFPLYYDTGTGEPATVEVLRVSPEDAPSLINELADTGRTEQQRKKLAGTALFHFGAFLDAQWRKNDIMWGRLDGCERVLAALFPEDERLREALLQEAQLIILHEEMDGAAYDQLIDRFAKALAEQKQATLDLALKDLLAQFGPAESTARQTQLARVLKALLTDQGMIEYVRQYYEVNRQFDTGKTLKTSARALTITGRILQDIEKHHGDPSSPSSRMVWVTRTGRALQTLLTISTPGSLPQAIYRHWLGLLYIFEALIVGGSILFSSPPTRNFGLTAFGVTAALHLASLLTGDLIGRKRGFTILLAALLGLGLLGLAALGALALYSHHGPHGALCARDDLAILKILCWLF